MGQQNKTCCSLRVGPLYYVIASAADAFVLARFIGSWCRCRCLHVGPFHWQLVLLPMPSRWFIAYELQQLPMGSRWPVALAAGAAADAFKLAHSIRNCSSCQWICAGPLHMQFQQLPMPSRWPIAYALQQLPMPSCWPIAYAL